MRTNNVLLLKNLITPKQSKISAVFQDPEAPGDKFNPLSPQKLSESKT